VREREEGLIRLGRREPMREKFGKEFWIDDVEALPSV